MAKCLTLLNNLIKPAVFFGLVCFCFAGASAQNPAAGEATDTEKRAEEAARIWSGASYRRAAELHLQAAGELRKSGDALKSAKNLREAARLKYLLAEYDGAISLLRRAVRTAREKKDSVSEADSLSLLSVVYLHKGEIAASEKSHRRALAAAIASNDPAARAGVLDSAAEFHLSQTYSRKTVELYEEALLHAEQTADAKLIARILLGLSYAHLKDSDPLLGLATAEKSLLKWREAGDRRGEAISHIVIGLANKILSANQESLAAYQTAEAMFPPDVDFIEHARLLIGVAAVHNSYNEAGLLEKTLLKALRLYAAADYLPGQIAVLPSLIKVNLETGNRAAAEEFYREIQILSKKLNNDNYLAYAQEIFGSQRLAASSIDEAVEFYQSALKIFRKSNDANGAALINQKLGEAFQQKNLNQPAETHFTRALDFNRSIKNRFAVSNTLYHLAKLKASENRSDEALKLVEESLDLTENLYSETANARLKQTYLSNIYDRYELSTNLLMKKHRESPGAGYHVRALQMSERARARAMLENLTLAQVDFVKDAAPETVRREKEIRVLLSSKTNHLTDLLSAGADRAAIAALDEEIGELELELERIKAFQKQTSPLYSAIVNPAPFAAEQFQRDVLDDESLLLEFSFGETESYLWLVGKTEIISYVLPPRREIERRIETLRKTLGAREPLPDETVENYQARVAAAEIEYNREADIFSRELLGQVAGTLAGKRLIIVPDGKLHYFPVAALPFPGSVDETPILLTNETTYEPSAATLALLMEMGRNRRAASKNLLVFSDPIFSAQDARLAGAKNESAVPLTTNARQMGTFDIARSLDSLARLEASGGEAEAIRGITGDFASTVLSGAAATRERALESSVADYKIVHFATHGLFDEQRPELSGIVLSQIDENGQSRNGVVRLPDIYAMNLSADAVILNACGTGIGKEIKGEGLKSLNNAFLQTGAKSVVSSLWKIDDYAARELMSNFYRELTSGTATTSEALRRAQINLRRNPQYQSPFYWAAFTAQGDFRIAPRLAAKDYRVVALLIFGTSLVFFSLLVVCLRRRFNYSTAKL